jgi:hypothetical protein
VDNGLKGGTFAPERSFTVTYDWRIINQGGIIDRLITGKTNPIIKFVDIDNDEDLDIIYGSESGGSTSVFTFNGSQWVSTNTPFSNTSNISDIKANDLNGDGIPDIAIANGSASSASPINVFLSNGSNYGNAISTPQAFYKAKVAINDMNNDGQAELVVLGFDNTNVISQRLQLYIYQLHQNTLIAKQITNLTSLTLASYDLGDYDNDQDLDIITTGQSIIGLKTYLYKNTTSLSDDNIVFTQESFNALATKNGTIDFMDFDSDGDLDILITGENGSKFFRVYINALNEGINNWIAISQGLPAGITDAKIDIGDFNGDGYADLIYTGNQLGIGKVTVLNEFDPSSMSYVASDFSLGDIKDASVEFGDLDGDGDLDFCLAGSSPTEGNVFKIYLNYRNESAAVLNAESIPLSENLISLSNFIQLKSDNSHARDLKKDPNKQILAVSNIQEMYLKKYTVNSNPQPPKLVGVTELEGTSSAANTTAIQLAWNSTIDDHTPSAALTYAIKVGTTQGGQDIMSPNSTSNGLRITAEGGNAGHNLKWKLALPDGTYYWSVQAIDASLSGSLFSQTQKFIINSGNLTVNNPPQFVNNDVNKTISVSDFIEVGQTFTKVDATDPEGQAMTYSITSGNDDNWFSIDSQGNIKPTNSKPAIFPNQVILGVKVMDNINNSIDGFRTINFCLIDPGTIPNLNGIVGKTFRSDLSIDASNKVIGVSDISYQSLKSITLSPGFEVNKSSVFKVSIGTGCPK